jgi:tetratricopeptide (TPR) repeat protein
LKLAASYERLAAAGKANIMRGEIWTEFAQAGAKQVREPTAAPAVNAVPGPLTLDKVYERYRQAGAAYQQAASQVADAADKANCLWLSTQRYLSGQDRAKAASVFEQLQQVDAHSPHFGEGWYLLGESHRLAKNAAAAESAYLESIKYPTHFAYRARLQLAQFAQERGDVDHAEAVLQQNLVLLRLDRDDEAQEKSLFAIGNLFFNRRNYKMAAERLEEALDRFPDNPEAIRARFNLAQSYQQLADPKNANPDKKGFQTPDALEHWAAENKRLLVRAAEEFEKLGPLGDNAKAEMQLDGDTLIKIAFNAAECRLMAGQYAEGLRMFEKIAEYFRKPQRTAEEQEYYKSALVGTIRCMLVLKSDKKYRDKILQVAAELQLLLDDVDEKTRTEWTKWLQDAKDEAEGRKKKTE